MQPTDLSFIPEWLHGEGPHQHIVVTSRVRLARNLGGHPYPGWAKKAERVAILERLRPAVESLPEMQGGFIEAMQNIPALDKQLLVERHLISREHAAKGLGSAVAITRKQTICLMINEEDHLRMQAMRPGLQLMATYQLIDRVDLALEESLDMAFHPKLGYLTACPSNVGTGMRASAMLHLPGLVLAEQVDQVIQAVNKVGLAVRGLYGEGTEAMGNLFQISNQTTLGEEEVEIIARLNKVIETIIEREQTARLMLVAKKATTLLDQIGRAYGVLFNAYSITSKEALNLLSFLKLSTDLNFYPPACRRAIDDLFMETQPAHLQKNSQQKLSPEQRDSLRANIVRNKLKQLPGPDFSRVNLEMEESSEPRESNDE